MKTLLPVLLVVLAVLGVLALIVGFSAFLAWLVWLAWKFVAVAAFGAPALSFLQCWIAMTAINILLAGVRNVTSSSKK